MYVHGSNFAPHPDVTRLAEPPALIHSAGLKIRLSAEVRGSNHVITGGPGARQD
jgi:hypothetical protein